MVSLVTVELSSVSFTVIEIAFVREAFVEPGVGIAAVMVRPVLPEATPLVVASPHPVKTIIAPAIAVVVVLMMTPSTLMRRRSVAVDFYPRLDLLDPSRGSLICDEFFALKAA